MVTWCSGPSLAMATPWFTGREEYDSEDEGYLDAQLDLQRRASAAVQREERRDTEQKKAWSVLPVHAYTLYMYVQCTCIMHSIYMYIHVHVAHVSVDRTSHSICTVCSMSWPEAAHFSLERKELSSGVATCVALSL